MAAILVAVREGKRRGASIIVIAAARRAAHDRRATKVSPREAVASQGLYFLK